MANPLVAQGTLNRLLSSIVVNSNTALNVTSGYLGREAIRLSIQGESTQYINTMTGAVTSPEPYMLVEIEVNLLKSQPLANLYKAQMETNSLIGDITVYSDSPTLDVYDIANASIKSIRQLNFAGEDANYTVTLGGFYYVNASLFGG